MLLSFRKENMIWRWTIAGLLLLSSLWFGNLALFNWWAGGGPPTPHPEIYALRGNIFFALACLLFVGFVTLSILNIRRRKQRDKH